MQRRVEQADGDRQPAMMRNSSERSLGAGRAAAWRARRGGRRSSEAMIIWRTAPMRAGSKNMCSVRHRPMPSAPNLRAVSCIERGFGVGADASCGGPLSAHVHELAEVAGELAARSWRPAPMKTLAGGAVERDGVAAS